MMKSASSVSTASSYVLLLSCCSVAGKQFAIDLKEILRCEDSGTEEISYTSVRLSRVSRNSVTYITNYTMKIPLDDNLSVVSEVSVWGNGGWRPGFFTLDIPHFCTGCKNLNPKWFQELIKNTGMDDFPIPPGTYLVNASNISFAEFNIPMWHYGKYRLINQLYKDNILVGCIGMISNVVPIRKKNSKKH